MKIRRSSRNDGATPAEPRYVETLLVSLTIAAISWLVLCVVVNQQAFLDFYYLPIAWASWRLGRQRAVTLALAASTIVLGSAFMNEQLFEGAWRAAWMRWINLGVWSSFLFLTAYSVSLLAERDRQRIVQLKTAYRGVIEILARFIDAIDRSTENHSRRVAARSVEVGRELGMNENDLETLRVAACLHDIGKVEVSEAVLNKAGALTPEERAEMESHVDLGTALLDRTGGLLQHVIPLVMYHHERWDGRGYKRLAGTGIPLGARIIAVCDTYDAIVADRPYRLGSSHSAALGILRDEAGTQFDPRVVEAFIALYDIEVPATVDDAGDAAGGDATDGRKAA